MVVPLLGHMVGPLLGLPRSLAHPFLLWVQPIRYVSLTLGIGAESSMELHTTITTVCHHCSHKAIVP
jgi:hypothetical protein